MVGWLACWSISQQKTLLKDHLKDPFKGTFLGFRKEVYRPRLRKVYEGLARFGKLWEGLGRFRKVWEAPFKGAPEELLEELLKRSSFLQGVSEEAQDDQ